MAYSATYSEAQIKEVESRFISKVYGWMAFALFITAFVSYYTISTPSLMRLIFSNSFIFLGLIVGELLLVGYLSIRIQKLSAAAATSIFLLYSGLNGLTLSVIFLAFTSESLTSTFVITAGTFGIMSIYGYFTKKDLTTIGNLVFMGLIGVIIASVVNIFFYSEALYWITTYVGILVFVGLTAYDTQKIKQTGRTVTEGSDTERKSAIFGALRLYLDFINLFLLLLRIFGRRR